MKRKRIELKDMSFLRK